MQKKVFMGAMIAMSDMSLEVAGIATAIEGKSSRIEDEEVKAQVEKAVGDLKKSAKEIYDNSEKTIRAFFMANNKEEYVTGDFDERLKVLMTRRFYQGTVEALEADIVTLCGKMAVEIKKVAEAPQVSHDSGSTWKKNRKDDKARFTKITKNLNLISEIVS